MIIVKVVGGLGNQMYCYGIYRKILALDKTAKLDVSDYNGVYKTWPYELERIFNVETTYADANEIKLIKDKTDIVHKVLRRLGLIKRICINVDPKNQYIPKVLDLDNVYLNGYWSSFDYYSGIESVLKNDFTFKLPLDTKNSLIANEILKSNSIGIHIRRGDYLDLQYIYEILSADYYNKAIEFIESRVDNPKYYCFSNDIEWCQNNLRCKDITFVEGNTGADSYKDLQLMSLCKNNIVANSTFSIWAAWLNANPSKVVVRPRDYFIDRTYMTDHYWPSDWICMDN